MEQDCSLANAFDSPLHPPVTRASHTYWWCASWIITPAPGVCWYTEIVTKWDNSGTPIKNRPSTDKTPTSTWIIRYRRMQRVTHRNGWSVCRLERPYRLGGVSLWPQLGAWKRQKKYGGRQSHSMLWWCLSCWYRSNCTICRMIKSNLISKLLQLSSCITLIEGVYWVLLH